MTSTKSTFNRRAAIKSVVIGATAASSPIWIKPVVESVVLPSHAETTELPVCYSVSVRVFDLTFLPGSGNDSTFKIELTSDAPELLNAVEVSAVVSNGVLVGAISGLIYTGNSIIFAWTGPAVPGTPVPSLPTQLTVNWTCATSESGSLSFDLVQMVTEIWAP